MDSLSFHVEASNVGAKRSVNVDMVVGVVVVVNFFSFRIDSFFAFVACCLSCIMCAFKWFLCGSCGLGAGGAGACYYAVQESTARGHGVPQDDAFDM